MAKTYPHNSVVQKKEENFHSKIKKASFQLQRGSPKWHPSNSTYRACRPSQCSWQLSSWGEGMMPCIPLGILLNRSLRPYWSNPVTDMCHARDDAARTEAGRIIRDQPAWRRPLQDGPRHTYDDATHAGGMPRYQLHHAPRNPPLNRARAPHHRYHFPRSRGKHPGNVGTAMMKKGNRMLWPK